MFPFGKCALFPLLNILFLDILLIVVKPKNMAVEES